MLVNESVNCAKVMVDNNAALIEIRSACFQCDECLTKCKKCLNPVNTFAKFLLLFRSIDYEHRDQ
jgi:hypothetical protein